MVFFRLITEDSWVLRLLANHIGYISFAVPIAALFLISKRSTYTYWPQPIRSLTTTLIRFFISDPVYSTLPDINNKDVLPPATPPAPPSSNFTRRRVLKLLYSFFGLQISYLLWGLLQERMMTQKYGDEKFTNSQFLVFVNRSLATVVAYVLMKLFYPKKKITNVGPPLYRYGIISYANCMSTWFQYESLLYISFPVQVIAKSIKTIPVMIVGKFVSKKTYPLRQYLLMLVMAFGIALFLSGYHENDSIKLSTKKLKQNITTLNGVILLVCYLAFDAFTSNYQKLVFDRYPISFLNMMFSVNLISTVITVTSLVFNGTLFDCLFFLQRHRLFAMHVFATSLSSSVGQLFIFSTIEEFGPVVFTIIMTVRQAFSIVLSCIFYGHQLSWLSLVGINVAFGAIFTQALLQFKKSKQSNSSTV